MQFFLCAHSFFFEISQYITREANQRVVKCVESCPMCSVGLQHDINHLSPKKAMWVSNATCGKSDSSQTAVANKMICNQRFFVLYQKYISTRNDECCKHKATCHKCNKNKTRTHSTIILPTCVFFTHTFINRSHVANVENYYYHTYIYELERYSVIVQHDMNHCNV